MVNLTDDIVGLIDHYGEDDAVVVGHDWGAPVAWNVAQRAPERVRAVAALSVPHGPRSPHRPTDAMKHIYGDHFFYVLYFQSPGVADAELIARRALFAARVHLDDLRRRARRHVSHAGQDAARCSACAASRPT